MTLLMDDELTDQLIPKLMDLFKMPEEQREFMFDFYIPEVNYVGLNSCLCHLFCHFEISRKGNNQNVQYSANEGLVRIQNKCLVPI